MTRRTQEYERRAEAVLRRLHLRPASVHSVNWGPGQVQVRVVGSHGKAMTVDGGRVVIEQNDPKGPSAHLSAFAAAWELDNVGSMPYGLGELTDALNALFPDVQLDDDPFQVLNVRLPDTVGALLVHDYRTIKAYLSVSVGASDRVFKLAAAVAQLLTYKAES